ncbi:MAG: DUF4383 domain-containing protein [Acidobacteria bacterium]|nr:DUF4383 domain-containing protein [Acidobacteriota bacterium]
MAKTYSVVVGAVLLLVGIIGFIAGPQGMMGMVFTTPHNLIHILSGIIGLYCGLAGGGKNAGAYAKIFGVVYTIIAIAGFAGWQGAMAGMELHLSANYNVIHLIVGIAGLAAGFLGAGAGKAAGAGA